jgi:hypothetical protein
MSWSSSAGSLKPVTKYGLYQKFDFLCGATEIVTHVILFLVRSLGMTAFGFAILNRQIRQNGNYYSD